MAVSAMANGGFLMKPYLVREIRDSSGATVYRREPEVTRQVVSRETSRKVSAIMESVTVRGSGMNAAIEGYRIATKTGTAQKVGAHGGYEPGKFILSLIGFVPAENPRIVLYVAVDEVQRGPQWGSQVSAPIFRRIMLDILNYLQIPPEKQAGLPPATLVEIPDLRGLTVNEAAALLDTAGLLLRLVGEGQSIVNQTPKAGAVVPVQTQVVVYLGDTGRAAALVVPELQGYTVREVGQVLSWLGLNLSAEGSGVALEQSPAAGTPVQAGAVIRVRFASPLAP
jgi:stage V sporulation protein D (sporulation-specific penicillin-binding protein)